MKKEIPTVACALFIAIMQLVGFVFYRTNSSDNYIPIWPATWKCILFVLAIWVVLSIILVSTFRWTDSRRLQGWRTLQQESLLQRHSFALPALAIALCWLPYLIVFLPGSLPWDGAWSMTQFTTDEPLSNHHPVLVNALYAGLMTLGETLYSANLGLFFIVFLQSAVCVAAFSLSVKQLIDMKCPRWLIVLAMAFYALYPAWGAFAQSAVKDTLFNGVFCLFVVAVVHLLHDKPTAGSIAALLLASILVCFVRNNGIYLVVPTLIALVGYFAVNHRKEDRRRDPRTAKALTACLAIVAAAYLAAMNVLWPALGIEVREDREMLAIPFQQTARYFVEHPDDITDQEWEAIDEVLDADQLAEAYLPDLYDPVKDSMRDPAGNMTEEQRSNYFAAWLDMGLRHPDTYLNATLAGTYAYFYPWEIVGPNVNRRVFYFYQQFEPVNTRFDVSYVFGENVRDVLDGFVTAQMDTPLLKCLYSPGTYVLLLLAALAYLIRTRNGKAAIVALLMCMLLLTVLAGPLNGSLRYILPIAATLPLLFGCALEERRRMP